MGHEWVGLSAIVCASYCMLKECVKGSRLTTAGRAKRPGRAIFVVGRERQNEEAAQNKAYSCVEALYILDLIFLVDHYNLQITPSTTTKGIFL